MKKRKSGNGATGGALFAKLKRFSVKIERMGDNETRKQDFIKLIKELTAYITSGGPHYGSIPSCFEDFEELYFILELIAITDNRESPFLVTVRKKDIYACAFKAGTDWYEYKNQCLFGNQLSKSGIDSDYKVEDDYLSSAILVDAIEFFFLGILISNPKLAQLYMEAIIYVYFESCRFSRIFDFVGDCLGADFFEKKKKPSFDKELVKNWGAMTDATIDAKFADNHLFSLESKYENGVTTNKCESVGVFTYEEAKATLGILKVEKESRIKSRLEHKRKVLDMPFLMPKAKRPKKQQIKEQFWSREFPAVCGDEDMVQSLKKFADVLTDETLGTARRHAIAQNLLKMSGIYKVDTNDPSVYVLNDEFKLPTYLFY